MKKLTHAELAAAQERGDWDLLWAQAMPLVKMVVGRMGRNGSVRSEDADDDLLQQGMLIAGDAMRAWRPLECAFSTHITNRVRSDLLNYATTRANGGIGSHMQKPVVLSLLDERPDAPRSDDGDEEETDNTFEGALTYAGVVMPGGQYDGEGYTPEGFRDPSEEADVSAQLAVRAALQHLTEEEQDLVCSVYGVGGGRTQTLVEYASARNIPLRTARRRMANAKEILALHLRNFRD